jgi:hypothetical protein
MANPLSNEKELYERIQKEKLSIPSIIWELLEHHLGNDVYAISLIAGVYVTGQEKEPIPIEDGEKIIKHCSEIRQFLKKIRAATIQGKGNE